MYHSSYIINLLNFLSDSEGDALLHLFAGRFEDKIVEDDPKDADPHAQQFFVGEGITSKKQDHQHKERHHIGEHHCFVTGGGLQQQFNGLADLILLISSVLNDYAFLPTIGGNANTFGVTPTACGTHDYLNGDFVAINGANDAFAANVALFFHICSFCFRARCAHPRLT